MTQILFPELLRPKLEVPKAEGSGTYWGELEVLVTEHKSCPSDWVLRLKTDQIRRKRKYDKYEEAITYYLLAALKLSTGDFQDETTLRRLLGKGLSDAAVLEDIVSFLRQYRWDGVHFEALASPSEKLRQTVKGLVGTHPLAYIREIAVRRPGVRFESATHFDVFIGNATTLVDGGGGMGLGVEAKFTSDVDHNTTYSTHRNQIIRNIEVGNSRCSPFVFLLVTPRAYRERCSRFYVYKMEEYLGDRGAEAMRRDALIDPGVEVSDQWKRHIGWLAWEDIVEEVFPNNQPRFQHTDTDALAQFLRERRLMT
jgi:hypothetical protein